MFQWLPHTLYVHQICINDTLLKTFARESKNFHFVLKTRCIFDYKIDSCHQAGLMSLLTFFTWMGSGGKLDCRVEDWLVIHQYQSLRRIIKSCQEVLSFVNNFWNKEWKVEKKFYKVKKKVKRRMNRWNTIKLWWCHFCHFSWPEEVGRAN